MSDFFSAILDDAILKLLAIGAVVGVAAGLFAGVIQQRHGSLLAWLRGIAVAVFVGMLVSLAMESVEWPSALEVGVIAVSAYIGEDVLAGLAAIGKMFGADPLGAFQRIFDALRGGGSK